LFVVNYVRDDLQVYVRWADTSESVFTREGADLDVTTVAARTQGVPWTQDGTMIIPLWQLPAGRPIYLDVRGRGNTSAPSMAAQARLGGAWVSFMKQ
jgi:hypothetical protein